MARAPLATEDKGRVVYLPRRPRPLRSRPFLVDLVVIGGLGLLALWFYAQMNPPAPSDFVPPIPSAGARPG
jgi:hypothetical protein